MAEITLYFRGEDLGSIYENGWSMGVNVAPNVSTKLDHDNLDNDPKVIGAEMSVADAGSQSYAVSVIRSSTATMPEVCRAVAILEARLKGTRGVLKFDDSVIDPDATCTSVDFNASGLIKGDEYQISLNFTGIGNIGGSNMQFFEQLKNSNFDVLDTTTGNIPFGSFFARDWALTANSASAELIQLKGTEIVGDGQFAVKMTAHATPAADSPLISQTVDAVADMTGEEGYYMRVKVDLALENQTTTPSSSVIAIALKKNTSAGADLAYGEFTIYSNRSTTCTLTVAAEDVYSDDLYIGVSCCANSTASSVFYITSINLEEVYETNL